MSYHILKTSKAKVIRVNYAPRQVLVELEDGSMKPAITNNRDVEHGTVGFAQFVKTPATALWYFSDN